MALSLRCCPFSIGVQPVNVIKLGNVFIFSIFSISLCPEEAKTKTKQDC